MYGNDMVKAERSLRIRINQRRKRRRRDDGRYQGEKIVHYLALTMRKANRRLEWGS